MDRRRLIGGQEVSNRLLKVVPPIPFELLRSYLKPTEFPRGYVLNRPGEAIKRVHFSNRGLVSAVKMMDDGRSVEVTTRGIEGFTTPEVLYGIETAILEDIVQIPMLAFSIEVNALRGLTAESPPLNTLFRTYLYLATSQLAQTAACNRLHSIEQRCCRWLLIAHDSALCDTFPVTHEFLAMMLGVQRPGVSLAAENLQKSGIIRYSHGKVTITDREHLVEKSCECYEAIQGQFNLILGKQLVSA